MCNQCIDCFFYLEQYPDDGSEELCVLNPDKPVEINYSVKLLVSHAEKNAANLPLLITGDFNATPESEVYRTATSLLNDSRVISYTPHRGSQNTFTDYGRSNSGYPIDFVFVSGEVKIFSHKTDDTLINGQYPSDHYPVVVELCID